MGQIITLEQQNSEQCFNEIKQILGKYSCVIIPMIVFTGVGVSDYGFRVVPSQNNAVPDKKIPGGN
jgi:hypothetical protein